MATKEELQAQADKRGVKYTSKTTKAELEQSLASSEGSSDESTPVEELSLQSAPTAEVDEKEDVKVNKNENGEATNGTTKEGDDSEVSNTDSIPQNGTDTISVLKTTDNEVAEQADSARTTEEVQFADESNPNQKSRVNSTQGAAYDQDGRPRTGGKSYGVSDDDITNFTYSEENDGAEPEEGTPEKIGTFLNTDTNGREWTIEEQRAVEEQLSDQDAGITARVTTSTGDYVRIKFFRNNLGFGTYRSRDFKVEEAQKYLDDRKEEAGI